ncbi:DNA topoisomerase VI subunit B, partial [Candidatus Thorarchaeota archaeon]
NGGGMEPEAIPLLLGRMLTGTKFTHKQSRGTFGLGGSLALLYGQVTTQKPIRVVTSRPGSGIENELTMRLDIEENRPTIIGKSQRVNTTNTHGTRVRFSLQGDWLRSKRKIIEYINQTSIIVPYASLLFENPDGETLAFPRVVHQMPEPPREMQPHPLGIDVEMLKKLLSETNSRTLGTFMINSFQRVGEATARSFLQEAELEYERTPDSLNTREVIDMMRAMECFEDFIAPSSDCLSPLGEGVLRAGLERLNPEYSVVTQRSPSAYEGHPFIVEVGIGYGGDVEPGMYRFANKIPLLYDEGSDVSTKVVKELNLKHYGLKKEDPIAFLTHICSTKIPYKTVGKEYIGDVDVIRREIDLGFKDCLRRLGKRVRRRNRVKRAKKRENRLQKYYEFMSAVLSDSLKREIGADHLFSGDETL